MPVELNTSHAVARFAATPGWAQEIEMDDKEFVLKICPNAFAYRVAKNIYELSNPTPNGTYPICDAATLDDLWQKAAQKLGKENNVPNVELRGCALLRSPA